MSEPPKFGCNNGTCKFCWKMNKTRLSDKNMGEKQLCTCLNWKRSSANANELNRCKLSVLTIPGPVPRSQEPQSRERTIFTTRKQSLIRLGCFNPRKVAIKQCSNTVVNNNLWHYCCQLAKKIGRLNMKQGATHYVDIVYDEISVH